jgi:catalase
MATIKTEAAPAVALDVLKAFDAINGSQPGFRPAHAKGMLLTGKFSPAPGAPTLTRAPHSARPSTPVTVRFSDATGLPRIPDNDPNAGPRGMAIRFHLAEHVHTDIIGHSVNAFPAHTVEEFLELLHAIAASGPDVPSPKPIEVFLGSHPAALAFVQAPKPVPASFFQESFYALHAHRFINAAGVSCYGRYRIRPDGPNAYLDDGSAAKQPADFLFDDLRKRLSAGAARMRIFVQVAEPGDVVNDVTMQWPQDRQEIEFGTLELTGIAPDEQAEQRHIIFDPIPRVDGIEPSDDPLLDPRATIYLASGRRRRKAETS